MGPSEPEVAKRMLFISRTKKIGEFRMFHTLFLAIIECHCGIPDGKAKGLPCDGRAYGSEGGANSTVPVWTKASINQEGRFRVKETELKTA